MMVNFQGGTILHFFDIIEPLVLERFVGCDSLSWVNYKELFYQVNYKRRTYFELFMSKMEISCRYFVEDLVSILTLKRKISAHKYVQ